MNEEDIKNNLVLPLLQSVGISADELRFESNFVIQLGRGVYTIKGTETKAATGRSDILCRRNGKALFLIELKAEGEELTDADRKQGLSYARLSIPWLPM
jgi:predicted type IV restriction endonuclease